MSLAPSLPVGQLSALTFSPEMSLEGAVGVQGGVWVRAQGAVASGAREASLSRSPSGSSQGPPP